MAKWEARQTPWRDDTLTSNTFFVHGLEFDAVVIANTWYVF